MIVVVVLATVWVQVTTKIASVVTPADTVTDCGLVDWTVQFPATSLRPTMC